MLCTLGAYAACAVRLLGNTAEADPAAEAVHAEQAAADASTDSASSATAAIPPTTDRT